MNFWIIILFNSCLAKPKTNENPADTTSMYYEDLGIVIESEREYYFREESVSVYYTRSYVSVCDHYNLTRLQESRPCKTRWSQTNSFSRTDAVLKECNALWNATLTKLQRIAKQRKPEKPVIRQARSIVPDSLKKVVRQTDIIINGEEALGRQKRGIITVVSTIFDIADFLCHIISSSYKRITGRYITDDMFGKLTISHENGYTQATNYARHGPDFETNLKTTVHCNRNLDKDLTMRNNHALLLSQLNLEHIEMELLSLAIGSLPPSTKFLADLIQICSSFESNDANFCRNIISSENLPIQFEGLEILNNTLAAYIEVKVPIRSHHFDVLPALKITNFGQFSQNSFFKLDTPELVAFNKNNDLFGIDRKYCSKNLCSMDALSLSPASLCVQSLIKNKTDFCEKTFRPVEKFCDFRRTANGYVIRAENALFVPDIGNSLSSKSIKNETVFVNEGGTLLCSSRLLNTTHRLLNPDVRLNFKGSYELKYETAQIKEIDVEIIPVSKDSEFEFAQTSTRKSKNFFASKLGQVVQVFLISSFMSIVMLSLYIYSPKLITVLRGCPKRFSTTCKAKKEGEKVETDTNEEKLTLRTSKNDVEIIVSTSET